MKELLADTRTLSDEQGRTREYRYSILIGETDIGSFACEDYGVKIEEVGGDCAAIPNITVRASRIDELMSLLLRNTVTPVALADVVADWL